MANAFTIWATLDLDTSELERKLGLFTETMPKVGRTMGRSVNEIQKQGGAAMDKLTSLSVAAGNLLAAGAQKAVSVIIDLGKQALGVTGELEQNLGGSEAVWGEWAENIQRIGATAFKTIGLSQSDYLAEANKMGSLLKGSGYTTTEAFELTTQVMQRASDVASIMGIDVSSAMQAIEGAAKGNFTMMDNLGVSINETALNAYALEKGLAKGTKGMTTQQKTGLAFQMFLEKTADYAGNYAKENDTLAGSLTTVSAAWENFLSGAGEDPAGDLADSVANAAKVVMKNIGEMVPRLATGAVQVMQKLGPMVKEWLGTVDFKELGSKLGEGLKSFVSNLPAILADIKEALSSGWNEIVWPVIQGLFSATFGVELPDWNTLVESISSGWTDTVWPGIQGFFKETFGLELPKWQDTVDEIKAWWDKVKEAVSGFWSAVFWIFTEDEDGQTTSDRLKAWWDKVAEAYGDYFSALFDIKMPDAGKIAQAIQNWWNGVLTNLQIAVGIRTGTPKEDTAETKQGAQIQQELTDKGIAMPGGSLWNVYGSYASGLNYVPYNDYLTYLHKGEAVLTADNAAEWRQGSGTAEIDYDRLANVLARALDGALVEMDSREVGRLVLPTVSREMGWEIRRRS